MTGSARFEAFVREYQDMVFATAVRLLGSAADAEDVAQTVFLRAYERFDQIGTSPAAPGWLKTVTTHLCLNHLERYRARWRLFSELDDSPGAGRPPFSASLEATGGALEAAEALDARDRHARLERALQALPDQQRVPLVLFHFEDMPYEAIAGRLGVSLGKVKTDIRRGRLALRRVLARGGCDDAG